MKHTVAVLVENHFGVLARVAGLFSARGFNIDSLTVGETQDPEVSRMTVIAQGDDRIVEQIMKQLTKLVDVIHVEDLTGNDVIERELVLIKVGCNAAIRNDIMHVVNTFRAKIVDVSPENMTIEVTGSEGKVDAMLELLRPFDLREVVRTGQIAMGRRTELKTPGKRTVKLASRQAAAKSVKKTKKK
jgi:acetolactate synthase-1/3 small subunit